MTNKEAIEILNQRKCCRECVVTTCDCDACKLAFDLAIKALEDYRWRPVKTEKISKEEAQKMADQEGMNPEDFEDYWRYVCEMPEDNQECLITTSVWGYVCIDTFYIDEDGAMYFEEHEDEDEVLAWMPLPDAYKKEDDNEES